ncbi:hypothetical protein A5705_06845 [Mycobacterium sp. E787]|nr:hypothetical protein A5705_06845 [Mycobacterium sp. E787]
MVAIGAARDVAATCDTAMAGVIAAWTACSPACIVAPAALIAAFSANPAAATAGAPATAGGNGTMSAAVLARNTAP